MPFSPFRLVWSLLALGVVALPASAQIQPPANYKAQLVEPLPFGEEFFEVTESGTLRRRYRVWGDYEAEMQAWKAKARAADEKRTAPPRTFRLGCLFLKDVQVVCPDVLGTDGKPLRGTYSTPPEFERQMRERVTQEYSDFTYAFTRGEVRCEWVFDTVSDLTWTAAGKKPAWSCQARAIEDQLDRPLGKYRDAKIDMWVWCAGRPTVVNGEKKQSIAGPPFGISYTQWQYNGAYNLAACGPLLPLIVHEINHRYLDNLNTIEGVQLTMFHGLNNMGYEGGDLGYDEQLCVYRSVYLHIIRPAMWRRFSISASPSAKPEPYSGKLYNWDDVADDCWFRLPLLGSKELAELTGLPSLKLVAANNTKFRHLTVDEADRGLLRTPYAAEGGETDVDVNNLLSLNAESCAVLGTKTGTWFVVRPEAAELFVERAAGEGKRLEAAGWINEGVRPLLIFRGPAELNVPKKEIKFFR